MVQDFVHPQYDPTTPPPEGASVNLMEASRVQRHFMVISPVYRIVRVIADSEFDSNSSELYIFYNIHICTLPLSILSSQDGVPLKAFLTALFCDSAARIGRDALVTVLLCSLLTLSCACLNDAKFRIS